MNDLYEDEIPSQSQTGGGARAQVYDEAERGGDDETYDAEEASLHASMHTLHTPDTTSDTPRTTTLHRPYTPPPPHPPIHTHPAHTPYALTLYMDTPCAPTPYTHTLHTHTLHTHTLHTHTLHPPPHAPRWMIGMPVNRALGKRSVNISRHF